MTIRVPYSAASRIGEEAADIANELLAARARLLRFCSALDDMKAPGTDWVSMAAELGGGMTAVDAQNFYNLYDAVRTVVQGAALNNLSRVYKG